MLGALWLYERWVAGWLRLATGWAVGLVLLFSACCLLSRRLHDMGRAGWWAVYPLALFAVAWPKPHGEVALFCAGMLGLLALWLCAMPGQARPNRFGAGLRG